MASQKAIAVVGGAGVLGSAIISRFNAAGWNTVNIDFKKNSNVGENITLLPEKFWIENARTVTKLLQQRYKTVDAVVSAGGGWAGGHIGEDDTLHAIESMWSMNVQSAATTTHIASRLLSYQGLLVLTGAHAALEPTPAMVGYGMSKAATHHLLKSVAAGGLPTGACALGVLPITIDTPTNRKLMSDADFSTWTPPDEIAEKIFNWSTDLNSRLSTGSLLYIATQDGCSTWVPAE